MKVKDEINLTVEMENAKASLKGQQVSKYKGKAIELEVKFKVREDITEEQFRNILEDLSKRDRELEMGFEALLSFLERVLPVDAFDQLAQKRGE